MNFGQIYRSATAQVVALTQLDRLPNANEAFVKAMVNAGYHRIERAAMWKFSEAEEEITSVAGQREAIGVPTNLSVPLMVHDIEWDRTLDYHDERQKILPLSDTGHPQYYSVWSGGIRFYPLPTTARGYTLRYYRSWTDLVDDSDEPLIPETYHDLLINYGAGKLAQHLPPTGDRFLPHSQAEPYLVQFENDLQRMLDSPHVMKTWDAVPNYGFEDEVLSLGEW